MSGRHKIDLAWGAVAALLGMLIAFQLWAPLAPVRISPKAARSGPSDVPRPAAAVVAHGAPVEFPRRPPFSPSRRPPPPAEAVPEPMNEAPPPAPPVPRLLLRGVLISGDQRTAIVEVPGEPAPLRLQTGDDIGGWRVGGIEADRVVLRRSGSEHMIPLDVERPQEPPRDPDAPRRRIVPDRPPTD